MDTTDNLNLILTIFQILQALGIIIPVIGIYGLLKMRQTNTSTKLLIANIGVLIMNSCYLLILRSDNLHSTVSSFRIMYLGNIIFYIFFIMFVFSYLQVHKFRMIIPIVFIFEIVDLYLTWDENAAFKTYNNFEMKELNETALHYLDFEYGTLSKIRYAFIIVMMLFLLAVTLRRMYNSKIRFDKHNYAKLSGSIFVVMISLSFTLAFDMKFDIVPISTSIACIFVIIGVLKGDFYSIVETGRDTVFDAIQAAIIMVDEKWNYIDANSYAKSKIKVLNYLNTYSALPPSIREMLDSEEINILFEGSTFNKNHFDLYAGNEVVGKAVILTDVTRETRLWEQVVSEKEKAQAANIAKSTFMSNMSHEIRTPMNAIVGMSEILMRSDMDSQYKQYVENIRNSGDALLSIINDILDFSKIESGKLELVESEYEPISILNDLSMIFLNRIGSKPISLIYDIDPRLPAKLYGDSLRIRQIITNIANNAIKFTDEGYVKITIKVRRIDNDFDEVMIAVKDSGMGIKEEDLQKIFESFSQVDTKRNHEKEGTGLGLAISKQLIELMGGTIHVQSVYGEGSDFIMTVKQRHVCDAYAVDLHYNEEERKSIRISGIFENVEELNELKNLCRLYKLNYVDFNPDEHEDVNYIFTDVGCYKLEKDIFMEFKYKHGSEIVVLQNPMGDPLWDKEVAVVNAPLYTVNFVHVLNHEVMSMHEKHNETMDFIAPDAKILVVDDNDMNLKVAAGLLEPLQMKIDTVNSAMKALEMLKGKEYHMVFMDHMMPIMDGVEATEIIRSWGEKDEYFKKLPIIALSANAVSGAKEEFMSHGMNDFVSKPIEMKQILGVLREYLPPKLIDDTVAPNVIKTDLYEDVEPIEGLDPIAGIRNSGSRELFYNLLGDFYKLIDTKSNKIEKCLADGLIKDYTIEVHALKNTARMIGAIELSEKFLDLENHGRTEDCTYLERETANVLEFYRSYKEILKPYGEIQNEAKDDVSLDELKEILAMMKEAVESFDLDTVDAGMKRLEEVKIPQDMVKYVNDLRVAVADVAMEDILRITTDIIANM